MIRFRFALQPVKDVQPWGDEHRRLHWFALTSGWYWIEAGDHELLRYADEALRRWALEDGREPVPYADYFVVRLWEDVLEMVSELNEPVPADLVDFIAAELPDWATDEITPQAEAAGLWHAARTMYMGPLTNGPRIRLWRTIIDGADTVTLDWRQGSDSDIRFAAPATGRVVVPTEAFDAAVDEFDRALIEAMEDRVTELETSGPPAGVELDLHQLRSEHLNRATHLQRARAYKPRTDWATVRTGARELLAAQFTHTTRTTEES